MNVAENIRDAIDNYTRKIAEDRASAIEAFCYAQFQEWLKEGVPPSRLELVEMHGMEDGKIRYTWMVRPMVDDARTHQ